MPRTQPPATQQTTPPDPSADQRTPRPPQQMAGTPSAAAPERALAEERRASADVQRTVAVLDLLRRFRFLTRRQLSLTAGCAPEDLDRLEAADYIVGFDVIQPFGDGTGERVYALARTGAHALMARLGLDRTEVAYLTPSARKRSLLSLEHTLLRNEIGLAIAMAATHAPDMEILSWEMSPLRIGSAVHLYDERRGAQRVPLVADGLALVRVHGRVHGLLVEADRGTVSLPRMVLKYRGYVSWWRSGGMERTFGVRAMRVLTVATSEKRMERLRATARAAIHRGTGTRLLWFATDEDCRIDGPSVLTAPRWKLAHTVNSHRYGLFPP